MPKLKTAVLISGRGSNMLAIIEAAKAADYPAEICLVLANKVEAGGLQTARDMGIEAIALPHRDFASRQAFDEAVTAQLQARGIELIVLAGFMRILTPAFINAWEGRILNIHPSLLPKYPGLDTHARAIEAGDAEAGCTVHLVTEVLDDGPIIAQASVPILPGDTPDSLANRILVEEHRIYPQAVAQHAHSLLATA